MSTSTCNIIKDKKNKLLDDIKKINDTLKSVNTSIKTTNTTTNTNTNTTIPEPSTEEETEPNIIQKIIDWYHNTSYYKWRQQRLDITLLFDFVIFIICVIIAYFYWPSVTYRPDFFKSQYEYSKKLPITAFTIEELNRAENTKTAYKDHKDYFYHDPFSDYYNGLSDMLKGTVALTLMADQGKRVMLIIIYAYIIWFVLKYWQPVISGFLAFLLMLLDYSYDAATGAMGCKWFIRAVTGWKCNSPSFSKYFTSWRQIYVDRPVYDEKIRYIKRYEDAKYKYYKLPKYYYIDLPLIKYGITFDYYKDIYIYRTFDTFLDAMVKFYHDNIDMPLDVIYDYIVTDNPSVDILYDQYIYFKEKIFGKSKKNSTTESEETNQESTDICDDIDNTISYGRYIISFICYIVIAIIIWFVVNKILYDKEFLVSIKKYIS